MPIPPHSDNGLTYYEILNLPQPKSSSINPTFSIQDVRRAYHRALLVYHPDKAAIHVLRTGVDANPVAPTEQVPLNKNRNETVSITAIQEAYHVLLDPVKRAEYDASLCSALNQSLGINRRDLSTATIRHEGLETLNLDDLTYSTYTDENKCEKGLWRWPCRCGNEDGYLVTENDLEEELKFEENNLEQDKGREIFVGCRGCSLFIRVTFEVDSD